MSRVNREPRETREAREPREPREPRERREPMVREIARREQLRNLNSHPKRIRKPLPFVNVKEHVTSTMHYKNVNLIADQDRYEKKYSGQKK